MMLGFMQTKGIPQAASELEARLPDSPKAGFWQNQLAQHAASGISSSAFIRADLYRILSPPITTLVIGHMCRNKTCEFNKIPFGLPEELIEPLRHQCTALMQERLVVLDAQQRWINRNALGLKCPRS
jgi:hypothetical protein